MNLRNKNWILGLAIGATMPLSLPAQAGILGLSEQDEIRAGQQVAAQAQKEYGRALPANDPRARRVRAIGMQFARLSTRKTIPYSYTVLQNDKVLNAFAAPGGPIFVTTKLLSTASNDAELAYVLGHETAHIDKRHIVEQVEKQQKAGLIAGIAGAILGRGGGGNAIGAIANIGWAVVSRGHSRADENQSDAVGVRWMSQLGYDPRAAITMLGKLDSGSRGGGGLEKYLATHPAPKARQDAVRAQITKENLLQVAQRAGGPRLTAASGTYTSGGYSPSSHGTDGSNRYPDADDAAYYPPGGDDVADNNVDEISFGNPLRLVRASDGTANVVLAPVAGFARWAGATVSSDGYDVALRRSGRTIELRRNSAMAYVNNRSVMMSASPAVYNGVLYAPLGLMAEGMGARAALVNNNTTVRLTMDGRSGYVRLP